MAQGDLQRIVIRVTDGGLIGIATKIRSQRASRAVVDLIGRGGVSAVLTECATGNLSRREIRRVAQE